MGFGRGKGGRGGLGIGGEGGRKGGHTWSSSCMRRAVVFCEDARSVV